MEILLQKDALSSDVFVIADEMYLRKCAEFHGSEFIDANENGNLSKGIVVFMIAGLKNSLSLVVCASPEISINGEWQSTEFSKCISAFVKGQCQGGLLLTTIQLVLVLSRYF